MHLFHNGLLISFIKEGQPSIRAGPHNHDVRINGGFTVLAAFLVWRLATASDADRKAANERENRMARRIDILETTLVDLTARGVEAQNNLSGALRELKDTLERKPCLLPVEKRDR